MAADLFRQIAFVKRKCLTIRIFRFLKLSAQFEDTAAML